MPGPTKAELEKVIEDQNKVIEQLRNELAEQKVRLIESGGNGYLIEAPNKQYNGVT